MHVMRLWVVGLLLCIAGLVLAAGSTGWRGDGTGRFPVAAPATEWSKEKNVLWATALPAWSNASPILVGDRLYVTAEPNLLVCVNAIDGKILWQHPVDYYDTITPGLAEKVRAADKLLNEFNEMARQIEQNPGRLEGYTRLGELCTTINGNKENAELLTLAKTFHQPPTHGDNGYASSTPASDGTNTFVLLGSGVVACFDKEGTRKWCVLPAKPSNVWGHSASPLVVGAVVLVHIENKVIALDAATGNERWRTQVNGQAWGSPVSARLGATELVITASGDILRVADGKRLASNLGGLNYNAPVVQDNVVYFIDGERTARAFKLPAEATEEMKVEKLWDVRIRGDRYYASPLIDNGLVYAINQAAHLVVLDATTGALVYEKDLDLGNGTVYPSITLAGANIFISRDNGATLVLTPGKEYKEVAKNSIEAFRGTPIFDGARMYLRARTTLFCIG